MSTNTFTVIISACTRSTRGHLTRIEVARADRSQIDGARADRWQIDGMTDASVRETSTRVRSALSAYSPGGKFPAKVRVDSANRTENLDLAIAVGALVEYGVVPAPPAGTVIVGELSLGGDVRPVRGIIPILLDAAAAGQTRLIYPAENRAEVQAVAARAPGMETFAVSNLAGAVRVLGLERGDERVELPTPGYVRHGVELQHVRFNPETIRACLAVAAGRLNTLVVGPPGVGKVLFGRAVQSLLPPLDDTTQLEVARVHSAAGLYTGAAGRHVPPLRAPHHTAAAAALLGGTGRHAYPGECALAHGGVLMLDELPEFACGALNGVANVVKDRITADAVPADFILVGTTNPCPCGWAPGTVCLCAPGPRRAYLDRVQRRRNLFSIGVRLEGGFQALTPSITTDEARAIVVRARERIANDWPRGVPPALKTVVAIAAIDDSTVTSAHEDEARAMREAADL